MNPILRVLLGILGIFVTIAAAVALLFSGNCVIDAVGMWGSADSAALNALVLIVAVAASAAAGLALWLGVRVSRWGLRGPAS